MNQETKATGGCGIAGTIRDEGEDMAMSERSYDLSRRRPVEDAEGRVLATGYYGLCLLKRFSGDRIPHLAERLATSLR